MKKRLIALFLALSICAPGLASARQDGVYQITSFEKGLNSHASPYSLASNQATEADNVRFNTVFGTLSKRAILGTYGTVAAHSLTGLHRFYKTDATKKLLASGSTKLYVGDDSAGTFQTIKTGLTDGKRFQFVTYQDVAIATNGYDQPVKYDGKTQVTADTDGSRTANELCAQLGAPFAEQNTGSNLDVSGWYQYKVAFYNGSTYSYSTARSNPILTGATVRDITLTDIPLGPSGTTHRYVYRTEGQASQAAVEAQTSFFQVVDIADNTTRTYNDAKSDATITPDAAPTWATVSAGTNVTPPLGSLATIHKERLFIGGNKTHLSDIYWSDTFNPNYFDPEDTRPIREDDGDSVTFIKEQLGALTIGKTNNIVRFYTDELDPNDWTISPSFSNVGCPAPYTATNTPIGIFYLARDGIYNFNGQYSSLISDAVTPVIRDILDTQIESAAGIWSKNEYQMTYTSAASGATANNRVLVYNTVRDAYSIDYKSVNCFTVFSSGTDFGTLYSGSSAADGKVFSEEPVTPQLIKNLKSEFDAGTYDDVANYGTEPLPTLELAWDLSIDNMVGTIDASSGIIDRPDTDGTWTSPVYQINATSLGLLYWNEALASGDVTWQVRTGATTGAVAAAAWSTAVTDPNGSNISGTAGNIYIQLRANLSTSSITSTPSLSVADGYLFKMTYSKTGVAGETSVLSTWKSGWTDMNVPASKKFIHRIKIFYRGTAGTLSFNMQNDEADVNKTFTIDLAQNPATNTVTYNDDRYKGGNTYKIFTYYPDQNTATDPSPIGQFWQFTVSENGTAVWGIDRIEILYSSEPIYD